MNSGKFMFWIYKLLSPIDDENIYSITQSHLNPYSKPYSKYDKTEKSYLPWCHGMQYISTVPTRLPQHRNIKFWGIEKVGSFLSAVLWPFPLPVPVWVTVWASANQRPAKSSPKCKKQPRNPQISGLFGTPWAHQLCAFCAPGIWWAGHLKRTMRL